VGKDKKKKYQHRTGTHQEWEIKKNEEFKNNGGRKDVSRRGGKKRPVMVTGRFYFEHLEKEKHSYPHFFFPRFYGPRLGKEDVGGAGRWCIF